MYILIAVLVGIIIGIVRRGKIDNILSHPYKKWYLGLAGVILMILLHLYYLTDGIPEVESYLPIINFVSYLLILIMLIFNLDDIYTILISIGLILNFIVTFINGGYMPVSESVISLMPLYSNLTQSIYTGLNGVYIIMQDSQTLLGFLGINIPIPFLEDLMANLATITGISPGDIFILIGLVGVTQGAMIQKKAPAYQEVVVDNYKDVNEISREPKAPKFESKTEELFFEDQLLPKNPLDKLFGEEEEIHPTRVLPDLTPLEKSKSYQIVDEKEQTILFESLEELTKPISQLSNTEQIIINESDKEIDLTETKPILTEKEADGFFVSQFFAERNKGKENDQYEPIMTDELFKQDTKPLEYFTSHDLNFDIKSRKKDIFVTDPNIFDFDRLKNIESKIEETQRIDEKSIKEQMKKEANKTDHPQEKLEKVSKETKPLKVKKVSRPKVEKQETLEEKTSILDIIVEENNKPLLEEELIEENTEFSSLNNQLKTESKKLSEKETMQEEKNISEEIQENNEDNKAIDYDMDALKALLNNTPISEVPEEMEAEATVEVVQEEIPQEETTTKVDLHNLEEEAASSKRGSFEKDTRSGYIVNKTYLEEKSSVDNSEEKMRDIWSQVAKETRDRKLGRRRQASSNYVTSNPYQEEMARRRRAKEEKQEKARQEREAFLQKQREELSKHAKETERILEASSPNPDTMTDEERLAAGYKLVTFEVAGKTISFWKK